jgi:hypothetical protein
MVIIRGLHVSLHPRLEADFRSKISGTHSSVCYLRLSSADGIFVFKKGSQVIDQNDGVALRHLINISSIA